MRLLFLQQWLPDELLKAIGWTLIHSLWQGLLAALLSGFIIICTRKSEARLRYNLLGAVLVLFLIAAAITFSQQVNGGVAAERSFAGLAVPVTDDPFVPVIYEPASAQDQTTMEKFVVYFNSNAGIFVLIWAIFFFVHFIKLFAGLAGVQRVRHYKIHAAPDDWLSKLQQLSRVLGIKRSVGLLQSGLVKVPVAMGFFKPVILVPLGLLSHLPPEQVETILLHELAHIRRKDYLVNIMQRFAESVFFFNPALLWISSLVRQEREACCDDIVITHTTHKGSYLEALVSFQEYSLTSPAYAMAITTKKHYLLNRVKRMITLENKKLSVMEKISLIIGLFALVAFTFIPQKEAISQKTVVPVEAVKEPAEPKATGNISLPVSIATTVPVAKKEKVRPALEISADPFPTDTVPGKVKEKEKDKEKDKDNEKEKVSEKEKDKTSQDEPAFPSISSTINDDGKTKTQTTSVTDKDGKKYSYTRLNNKLTSLVIDGKAIPENEIGNYLPLVDKIEAAVRENRARRAKDMEHRRVEIEKRDLDNKIRMAEKRQLRDEQEKQRKSLFDKQRRVKLDERSAKDLQRQREQQMKQREKLFRKKVYTPTINGREVIKNDIHIENPVTFDARVSVDVKNESNIFLQKTSNAKLDNNVHIATQKMFMNNQADMKMQFQLNTDFQNKLFRSSNSQSETGDVKIEYEPNAPRIKKPRVPVKSPSDAKPADEVEPGTHKTKPELPGKRVTT